jgi:hypothetical protein
MNLILRALACLLPLALGFPLQAFADSEAPSFPADQPIETQMNLGLFGFLGGSMNYSVGGKPLKRMEDFKTLIYPLRDEETTRLLSESQDCHFAAWMLYLSGGAVGVDVGLGFKPSPILGVDWFDRIFSGFVAAGFFWSVGGILDTGAESRKYNAVQRYNLLLKEKDQSFLGPEPQVYFAQQGPCLGLGWTF